MTSTAQDFTVYAGDSALPIFTVRDGAGVAIDLSTVSQILWEAARDPQSAPVLSKSKTGGDITFVTDGTNGQFQVKFLPADSAALSGYYIHRAIVTDGLGNVSTVTLGRLDIGRLPIATYSGDPANSTRDAMRSYIGDTDVANPMLYDAEIDYMLTQYPGVLFAAAQAARTLAGRYARKVNKRVGDLSINYSDIAKSFRALASDLQHQAETTGVTFYIGGVSKSDMAAVNAQSDRARQPFSRGQFDIPGGGSNPENTDPESR